MSNPRNIIWIADPGALMPIALRGKRYHKQTEELAYTNRRDWHARSGLCSEVCRFGSSPQEVFMSRQSNSGSVRPFLAAIVILSIAGAFGCANGEFRFHDPFDRQLTLSEAQHRYTVLIRWTEFQKARSFVAQKDLETFMEQMESLQEARFIDFEAEPVELDKSLQHSTVKVTYTLYTPSLPYEIEISELQDWTRNGLTNNWQVHSTFEGLSQLASN